MRQFLGQTNYIMPFNNCITVGLEKSLKEEISR